MKIKMNAVKEDSQITGVPNQVKAGRGVRAMLSFLKGKVGSAFLSLAVLLGMNVAAHAVEAPSEAEGEKLPYEAPTFTVLGGLLVKPAQAAPLASQGCQPLCGDGGIILAAVSPL